MMFKQPSKRVNFNGQTTKVNKSLGGSVMYEILNPQPTVYPVIKKGPIHNYDDYLRLYKRNNVELGIPFTERMYPEATLRVYNVPIDEPKLEYSDQIQVTLKVLKNGHVRIKTNAAIATLNEKYYSVDKKPSIKTVLQAYKSHGFSDVYLEKIKKGHERNLEFGKRVGAIIERIFDKKPVKKIKIKKDVEPEAEAEAELEAEVEEDEDDVAPDDGGLDVEPDEDEIVEEEEYISDAE